VEDLAETFRRMISIFPEPVEKPKHRFLDSMVSDVVCGRSEIGLDFSASQNPTE
jgi:hypothetical protein